jgi:hypothetical protein
VQRYKKNTQKLHNISKNNPFLKNKNKKQTSNKPYFQDFSGFCLTLFLNDNTREENQQIKEGQGATLWNDNVHKKRQKDSDARWTKKGGTTFYGYKDHVKSDVGSKLITEYVVTSMKITVLIIIYF